MKEKGSLFGIFFACFFDRIALKNDYVFASQIK